MKLLREFIRENLGSMFGLGRHVTINALKDIAGGPDALTLGKNGQYMRVSDPDHLEIDVIPRVLTKSNDNFIELDDDLDVDNAPL